MATQFDRQDAGLGVALERRLFEARERHLRLGPTNRTRRSQLPGIGNRNPSHEANAVIPVVLFLDSKLERIDWGFFALALESGFYLGHSRLDRTVLL